MKDCKATLIVDTKKEYELVYAGKERRCKLTARKRETQTHQHKRPIESYEHQDKERVNNPPVGLVTPETDPDAGAKKTYAYDPDLDPQLFWVGKAEHTFFEVPTVSLHVHERIEPHTIIETVRTYMKTELVREGKYDEYGTGGRCAFLTLLSRSSASRRLMNRAIAKRRDSSAFLTKTLSMKKPTATTGATCSSGATTSW